MTILQDPFMLTIIVIILSTLVIAFVKRIHIDRCLKSFRDDYALVKMKDGTEHIGKLSLANTGLETIYIYDETTKDNKEMSYILYTSEYPNIQYISRDHAKLNVLNKQHRDKALLKSYHPRFFQRLKRHIGNFFKILKDAMVSIFTQLSGKIKASGATLYASQEAQAQKINKELVGVIDSSFDPILEKYIGNLVIVDVIFSDGIRKISGILKDYTSQYVELWDVLLENNENTNPSKIDMLLPVSVAKVRHIGESYKNFSLKGLNFNIKEYDSFFRKLNRSKNKNKK